MNSRRSKSSLLNYKVPEVSSSSSSMSSFTADYKSPYTSQSKLPIRAAPFILKNTVAHNNKAAGGYRASAQQPNNSDAQERILSARRLSEKTYQNQLTHAQQTIEHLQEQIRLLNSQQRSQNFALSKYESVNAELPRLLGSHSEELRMWHSKYHNVQEENKKLAKYLKEKDQIITFLSDQNAYRGKNGLQRQQMLTKMHTLETQLEEKAEEMTAYRQRMEKKMWRLESLLRHEQQKNKNMLQKFGNLERYSNLKVKDLLSYKSSSSLPHKSAQINDIYSNKSFTKDAYSENSVDDFAKYPSTERNRDTIKIINYGNFNAKSDVSSKHRELQYSTSERIMEKSSSHSTKKITVKTQHLLPAKQSKQQPETSKQNTTTLLNKTFKNESGDVDWRIPTVVKSERQKNIETEFKAIKDVGNDVEEIEEESAHDESATSLDEEHEHDSAQESEEQQSEENQQQSDDHESMHENEQHKSELENELDNSNDSAPVSDYENTRPHETYLKDGRNSPQHVEQYEENHSHDAQYKCQLKRTSSLQLEAKNNAALYDELENVEPKLEQQVVKNSNYINDVETTKKYIREKFALRSQAKANAREREYQNSECFSELQALSRRVSRRDPIRALDIMNSPTYFVSTKNKLLEVINRRYA